MVTHDPNACSFADRTLFLADGLIVREVAKADAHQIHSTMEEVSAL
jgi:putative ABC transport system ATP-binding protein